MRHVEFRPSEAVNSYKSDELPLLVVNGQFAYQKHVYHELVLKLLDLKSQTSDAKFLLRKNAEVYRAMVGLSYSQQYLECEEAHQRLNPYWFFSYPIMHLYYRREKDTKKQFLEDAGMTSHSKASQIIIEHLREYVYHKPIAKCPGYSAITKNHICRYVQQYNLPVS